MLSAKLIRFHTRLKPPQPLPRGIGVLYPQQQEAVQQVIKKFFRKFYHDNRPRQMLVGINPGRYGAGITGINFTAPRQLKEVCGIDHPFGNSSELSAEFIYEVIEEYGGAGKFFGEQYIGSVSPLGYIKNGKNMNYYDDRSLRQALLPFINDCFDQQLSFGFTTRHCICIGGEKNYSFFHALNEQRKKDGRSFFEAITPLPHPRFILQYRRKEKAAYIRQYLDALQP